MASLSAAVGLSSLSAALSIMRTKNRYSGSARPTYRSLLTTHPTGSLSPDNSTELLGKLLYPHASSGPSCQPVRGGSRGCRPVKAACCSRASVRARFLACLGLSGACAVRLLPRVILEVLAPPTASNSPAELRHLLLQRCRLARREWCPGESLAMGLYQGHRSATWQ